MRLIKSPFNYCECISIEALTEAKATPVPYRCDNVVLETIMIRQNRVFSYDPDSEVCLSSLLLTIKEVDSTVMPPYIVSKTGPTEITEEVTRDACCRYISDLVEDGTL